jgi:ribosome-associated toxin RatA of RatAB toxin-antitoxin module
MAEQTESSINVVAPPERVMAVISDFPAYPEWTGAVKEVEVVAPGRGGKAKQVRFVLDAGAIKDDYTLAYDWSRRDAVSWTLVQGQMLKAMDGSYLLTDRGDGTTDVTYRLAVDVRIPMIGMLKRKAEKVIIDTALKELKKRVES